MSTQEDPSTPVFWDTLFRDQRMPWDAAGTPPDLERHLAGESHSGRVLIPGCGSAYEVRTFYERGWETVAIDFSAGAVERARTVLGACHSAVILGDFFSYDFGCRPFDIIYERAFLAAMPRKMWRDYADRVAELLQPGAKLIGFFVHGDRPGGPPFCLRAGELDGLLGEKFEKTEDTVVSTSVPVFRGKEHWEVWIRKN